MNELIDIKVQTTDQGSCLVSVAGELDVVTAREVRLALHAAIDHHDRIVVDLGRLHFCDCAGLAALLAANRAARARGVEMRLRAIPHALARIIRLTGAGGAFSIDPP
ncbi:STAS domain-containing protein [Streptomyces diastatochromogenes]|nr:STAS domain-containing protein [Streptomyces diastatochromogenes]